jgi:nitroreductase
MDVLEAIFTRRSIRNFKPDPVPEEFIQEILSAAMTAPSAGNQQPWQFIVIHSRELLDAIPDFHPHAEMVRQAPLAILVCGDLRLEHHKGFWVQDCSAAVMNLLLAAHALGLGAVWTGVYPREERAEAFRKLCGLPDELVPFAMIPVGYPNQPSGRLNRYNPSRVHYDQWKE